MILNPSDFNSKYMDLALIEAKKAYDKGEVPVGCVIVERESGTILAKSHNLMQQAKNPNYHAEMLAIDLACTAAGSKKSIKLRYLCYLGAMHHVRKCYFQCSIGAIILWSFGFKTGRC